MANVKSRIKRDDTVVVLVGKDRGRTGRVLKVEPARGRIWVEGIRVVKRHRKPTGDQPGAVIHKEAALDISNVALWQEDPRRPQDRRPDRLRT